MIEIIPNWHPIFVHFTLGMLLTGSAMFLVGFVLRRWSGGTRVTIAARWNLGVGVAFAIVTVATGYQAYYSVAHDTLSHAAMTIHLRWALASLLLFTIAGLLAWRDRRRHAGASVPLSVMLLAGTMSLAVTGYLGAENVYRHGIGVMRLPEASAADGGHAHGEGNAHDHGAPATAPSGAGLGRAHAEPDTAEAVLDAFHHALQEGDGVAALRWLADGAVIVEGGNAQTKAEYADHHLGSDMAFIAAMQEERLSRTVRASGRTFMIVTRTRLSGRFRNRDIDLVSAETAVLTDADARWRIEHLHWSN